MRYFVYIIIGVVTLAVIAGFFVVGSPREERARRFDEQRIQHLQFVQGQIGEYYRAKERLPKSLEELNDSFRGIIVPQDPEHRVPYGYEVKGNLTFELCANFNRPNLGQEQNHLGISKLVTPESLGGPFGAETWEHGADQVCFERTIDKDFFKPIGRKGEF